MKKTVLYLFLWSLSLILCTESFAQSHFVRLSIDEGYVNEHPINGSERFRSAGSATSLGIGYRLAYHHFLFDIGVGARHTFVSNQVPDSTIQGYANTESGNFVLGIDTMFAGRHDCIQRLSVQLPLMFGGEWQRVYAIAGVKVHATLWSKQAEQGEKQVHVSGMYGRDPLTGEWISASDMLPHEVQSQKVAYRWAADVPQVMLDVRLCAEIGCRLNGREEQGYFSRNDYYLSAFAEYGFSGLYHTAYSQLVVGVRFTALWQIKGRGKCMCITD